MRTTYAAKQNQIHTEAKVFLMFSQIVCDMVPKTWKIPIFHAQCNHPFSAQLPNPHPLRVFGVDDLHQPAGYLRHGT